MWSNGNANWEQHTPPLPMPVFIDKELHTVRSARYSEYHAEIAAITATTSQAASNLSLNDANIVSWTDQNGTEHLLRLDEQRTTWIKAYSDGSGSKVSLYEKDGNTFIAGTQTDARGKKSVIFRELKDPLAIAALLIN
jgi:hypothetical protein